VKRKTNCNAILNSSKAKIFSWLSWSEVGFFYFSGGFLALSLYVQSVYIIAWVNILALPYVIFSLSYQGIIAKQWCPLCLATQSVLVLEFIIEYAGNLFNIVYPSSFSIFRIVLIFLLPVAIWYYIKLHLLEEQHSKTKKYELSRLKNNKEIFNSLLASQKRVTHPTDGLGILLGNPNAANTLVKVCNPYCDPCAKAHPELEKLLENNNLKVQIVFMATPDEKDKRSLPVRHFLAIANQNDKEKTKQVLDSWYLAPEKDYNTFAKKYPLDGDLKIQNIRIGAMNNWCKAMHISFTPTFFINGYQLPAVYNIKDLKYLLE